MSDMFLERIIKGGVWATISKISGIIFIFGINVVLARIVTPDELGAYFVITSVLSLFVVAINFGLPSLAVKLIAGFLASDVGHKIKKTILNLSLITILNSLLIGVFLYAYLGDKLFSVFFKFNVNEQLFVFLAFYITTQSLLIISSEFHRGFHDIKSASIYNGLISPAIYFMVLLYILNNEIHIEMSFLFMTMSLANVIVLILAWYALLRKMTGLSGRHGDGVSIRHVIASAFPITLTNMATLLSNQGALWVVGYLYIASVAAIYGAVLKIILLLVLMHTIVASTTQSTIVELHKLNKTKTLQSTVQLIASFESVLGLMLMMIFLVFGEDILRFAFGEFYSAGYGLLVIMAISQMLGIVFGIPGMILMMTGYEKVLFYNVALMLLLRFALALALNDNYGLAGIALAWGIGGVCQQLISWYIVRQNLHINCHANFRFQTSSTTI